MDGDRWLCWLHVFHSNDNEPELLPNIATHAPEKIGYYNPIKSNYRTPEQYK